MNGSGGILGFVPLSLANYTLLYYSNDQEFIPQWALGDYNVTFYNVSLMWGNSGKNTTQSWKVDILPLWDTTWGLDQKSGA